MLVNVLPIERGFSQTEIEYRAEALLRQAQVTEVYPVPLEKIALSLNYRPLGFDPEVNPQLAGVAGMVDYEQKTLYVNSSDSVARQRFTLAHEIGHVLLHSGSGSLVDYRSNLENPVETKEYEANKFAAALLMPRTEFVRKWFLWRGNTELLGKYFGASPQAVEIRRNCTVHARV